MNSKTRKLTLSAMFAAIAYLIMLVCRIPIIPQAPYLKLDAKDMMLVICGFVQGPLSAVIVTIVVSLLELVTVSTSGIIGFIMNVLSSLSFVLPAALLYRKSRRLSSAVFGLIISTLLMSVMMMMWNHFITPRYQGMPQEAVDAMLLPVFLPFNLIKGGLNTAITLIVYKPLSRALRSAHFLETRDGGSAGVAPQKKDVLATYIAAVALIIVCVLAILLLKGVI